MKFIQTVILFSCIAIANAETKKKSPPVWVDAEKAAKEHIHATQKMLPRRIVLLVHILRPRQTRFACHGRVDVVNADFLTHPLA